MEKCVPVVQMDSKEAPKSANAVLDNGGGLCSQGEITGRIWIGDPVPRSVLNGSLGAITIKYIAFVP